MELVCPICNALASYAIKCEFCNNQMKVEGAIQDYFDDYSPYLDKEITEKIDGVPSNQCLHIFHCPNCHKDARIAIDKIPM